MTPIASTVIACPGFKVIVRLLEESPTATHLAVETVSEVWGTDSELLPRDQAWVKYLSQVNEYFR